MQGIPRRELSLFDSVCLIVGIMVGVGIFQTAPDIARGTGSWWGFLGLWVAGGLLSLISVLICAELAGAYPQEGGPYVYLTRAYGPWAGFLFGWFLTVIDRPGNIALIAFVFATYARAFFLPSADMLFPHGERVLACGIVVLLTLANILGVRYGKWTQNLLTTLKVAGLLVVIGLGYAASPGAPASTNIEPLPLGVAMILVLFSFSGWIDLTYVAGEVKDPARTITRALVLGMLAVTILYLSVSGAFLHALGYAGVADSTAVAVDTISKVLPAFGGRLISVLICLSALGVLNGIILSGARISYAAGQDHRAFRIAGEWNPRRGTPVRALLAQGTIALVLILVLGSFLETIVFAVVTGFLFSFGTSLSVIVLRFKEPETQRPYRVLGYPYTPIIVCAASALLACSLVAYRPLTAVVSLGVLLVGVPVYLVTARE